MMSKCSGHSRLAGATRGLSKLGWLHIELDTLFLLVFSSLLSAYTRLVILERLLDSLSSMHVGKGAFSTERKGTKMIVLREEWLSNGTRQVDER